jgi:hypothetical protein
VEFTAQEAAEILAPQSNLPNQTQVVEALANLWVDYFLLARVAAEDTTLEALDVSSLVEQNQNQELVLLLRDQVVQVDTAISEEELREAFDREAPGARVRARHILLRIPEGASPAKSDSVRDLAASLRERLLAGEDFGALAWVLSDGVKWCRPSRRPLSPWMSVGSALWWKPISGSISSGWTSA